MRYAPDEEPLHSKGSIYQATDLQRRAMQQEIAGLSGPQLKTAPIDQLAASLAEKYSINIPILDEANAAPAQHEVDINVSRDPMRRFGGGSGIMKGTEITITVPYTGDAKAFRMHASSHTVDYPLGRIGKVSIMFSRRGVDLDAGRVRQEFDAWIATIKKHLEGMRHELGNFNEALKAEATTAVNTRIEKLRRDDDLLGGLGFGGPKKPQ